MPAGRWLCRPPDLYRLVAKTQSGLFKLSWFSLHPKSQFLRETTHDVMCYSGNTVSREEVAFDIQEPPTPADWSPKKGAAVIMQPMNRFWKGETMAVMDGVSLNVPS